MITPIFSTGISIYNLEGVNNSEIVEYVKANSNFNKLKDIKTILTEPVFKTLNNIVEEKINEHYHQMYNNKYDVVLVEGWGNLNNDVSITVPHIHTTGIISAVYYPHAVDGDLTLLNPMVGLLSNQKFDMIDEYNPYTSEYISVPSETNRLVIFNSVLSHFARCKTKSDRISIAYNADIKERATK